MGQHVTIHDVLASPDIGACSWPALRPQAQGREVRSEKIDFVLCSSQQQTTLSQCRTMTTAQVGQPEQTGRGAYRGLRTSPHCTYLQLYTTSNL